MSQRNHLLGIINKPITREGKTEIVARLWGSQNASNMQFAERDWDAFFAFYARECREALVDQGIHLSVRNHGDLLLTAHLLEDELTKEDIRLKLRRTLTQQRSAVDEQRMLDGSITLAARLSLMIKIGSMPSEVSGRLIVPWTQGSLRDAIYDRFNRLPGVLADPKHDIIESDLTCRNVERIAGIEVVPTDNLVDHLRLVDRDKKLCLFQHITVLHRMKITSWYVISKIP